MSSVVLVDCNNFYVSCERVFNPALEKKPVIVLSNFEGAVVARSEEAKELGIGMGVPFFEIRDLCKVQGVHVLSSNFALYGDMSERIMRILSTRAPEMEIYSIDEAFLRLPTDRIEQRCQVLRRLIRKWVGIPVSLGIASTKTLAKVAGKLAKKSEPGVFAVKEEHLQAFPVGDIWGIGRASRSLLASLGIYTALQLKNMDTVLLRKKGGVSLERIQRELQGIDCSLGEADETLQTITRSRCFGRRVSKKEELLEAMSYYAATASEKLREQNSYARGLYAYVETSNETWSQVYSFSVPTNHTPDVMKAAQKIVEALFQEGLLYRKCGLTLIDLVDEAAVAPDLFLEGPSLKTELVDKTVDAVNQKFGKGALFYGSMGIKREWKMGSVGQSPAYTTSWDALPRVKA
jgi:DNA polymerase V